MRIHLNIEPSLLSCQVESLKFLPGRQIQAYLRLRIEHPQIAALQLHVQIALRGIVPGGEFDGCLPAVVEDVPCQHRVPGGSAPLQAVHAEAHRFGEISRAPALPDEIVHHPHAVRPLPVHGVSVDDIVFNHFIPPGGTGLRRDGIPVEPSLHVPEDIVVNQVHALLGALDEDRFPLLYAVQKQVPGNPVVLIAAVQPDMVRPEGVPEDIAAEQAVSAVVELHPSRFPRELHALPPGPRNQAVLHQHILRMEPCDAAHSRVPHRASANHGAADDLPFRPLMMPALVPHVDSHGIGPVDCAVLYDPVMPPVAGQCPSLGHGRSGGRVGEGEPLYSDVGQEWLLGREALLPGGELDHMLRRISVPGKTEMDSLAVGLHPVRPLLPGHLVVQAHLFQGPSIAEHHPPSVQISGHVSLVVFQEQPVVENVHRAERIVAPEHIRIQPVLPDPHPGIHRLPGEAAAAPACALLKIEDLFRRFDDHFPVAEGLIADHLLRGRPAPPGPDPLSVGSAVD